MRPRAKSSMLPIFICVIISVWVNSCSENIPVRGNVLFPGQSVDVLNQSGRLRISFVSALKREYQWDGEARVVKMIARQEPFLGRLGLYDPADIVGFRPHETRLVAQESVLDFPNYDRAYAFINESSAEVDFVYTSDGLAIGFDRVPARHQVNIDLWQILVKGKKPAGLVGAHNDSIHLVAAKTK